MKELTSHYVAILFPSNRISDSVERGVSGIWYLARQTVERSDIKVKKGDKAIIYQPSEVRKKPQKLGSNYIGSFSIESEPFIERRGDDYYAVEIRDFSLWRVFLSKDEVEKLNTELQRGSEFGRLIKTQVIMQISKTDYEKIIKLYGEKVENGIDL